MLPFFLKVDNKSSDTFYINQQYSMKMEHLNPYSIECSCRCKGSCIKYGKYPRKLIVNDNPICINIQRVYCKNCHKTHAILPTFIIPYELHTMDYVLDLVHQYKDETISSADYELKRYIEIFKSWMVRFKAIEYSMSDDIEEVITFSAYHYGMCFMQNLKRKNSKLNEVTYFIGALPT